MGSPTSTTTTGKSSVRDLSSNQANIVEAGDDNATDKRVRMSISMNQKKVGKGEGDKKEPSSEDAAANATAKESFQGPLSAAATAPGGGGGGGGSSEAESGRTKTNDDKKESLSSSSKFHQDIDRSSTSDGAGHNDDDDDDDDDDDQPMNDQSSVSSSSGSSSSSSSSETIPVVSGTATPPVSSTSGSSTPNGSTRITAPTTFDVLFGRGMPYQKHPGNKRMHEIVEKHKYRYNHAKRHDKSIIVGEVIDLIRNAPTDDEDGNNTGGQQARFLQKSGSSWVEQTKQRVFNKVGHALRGNKPGSVGATEKSRRNSRFKCDKRSDKGATAEEAEDAIVDTYPGMPMSESERFQRKKLLDLIAHLDTNTLKVIVRQFVDSKKNNGNDTVTRSPDVATSSTTVTSSNGILQSDMDRALQQQSALLHVAGAYPGGIGGIGGGLALSPNLTSLNNGTGLERNITSSLLSSLAAPTTVAPSLASLLALPVQLGLRGELDAQAELILRQQQEQQLQQHLMQQQQQQQSDLSSWLQMQRERSDH